MRYCKSVGFKSAEIIPSDSDYNDEDNDNDNDHSNATGSNNDVAWITYIAHCFFVFCLLKL